MRAVVAIDPGCPGAAVCMDREGVLQLAVVWRGFPISKPREWHVRVWQPGQTVARTTEAPRPSAVGGVLERLVYADHFTPRADVVVEGVFVGAGVGSSLSLEWCAASIAGPMEELFECQASRPKAAVWRKAVLGKLSHPKGKGERSKAAKAASLVRVPLLVPGLSDALAALAGDGDLDHLTDAAAMGHYQQRKGSA